MIILRILAIVMFFGWGFIAGYAITPPPVQEAKQCPICPSLPQNYFTIETIETEQCVTAVGETIVSRIVKQAKVETE